MSLEDLRQGEGVEHDQDDCSAETPQYTRMGLKNIDILILSLSRYLKS